MGGKIDNILIKKKLYIYMDLNDYPQNVNDKMTMTIMTMSVGLGLPSLCLHSAFALAPLQKWTQSGRRNSPLLPHRFTCLFAVQTTFSPLTLMRVSSLLGLSAEVHSGWRFAISLFRQSDSIRAPIHDASLQSQAIPPQGVIR